MRGFFFIFAWVSLILPHGGWAQNLMASELAKLEKGLAEGSITGEVVQGIVLFHVSRDLDVAVMPMSFFYELEEVRMVAPPEVASTELHVQQTFRTEMRGRWRKRVNSLTRRLDRFFDRYTAAGSRKTLVLYLDDQFSLRVSDFALSPSEKVCFYLPTYNMGDETPDFFSLRASLQIITEGRRQRVSVLGNSTEFFLTQAPPGKSGQLGSEYNVIVLGKVVFRPQSFRILHAVSDVHFHMYWMPEQVGASASQVTFLRPDGHAIGQATPLRGTLVQADPYPEYSVEDFREYFEIAWDQNVFRSGLSTEEWVFRERDRLMLSMFPGQPLLEADVSER